MCCNLSIFTELAPRLLQSIVCNDRLSLCPRLKSLLSSGLETSGQRAYHVSGDRWRAICNTDTRHLTYVYSFASLCLFLCVMESANTKGISFYHMKVFSCQICISKIIGLTTVLLHVTRMEVFQEGSSCSLQSRLVLWSLLNLLSVRKKLSILG